MAKRHGSQSPSVAPRGRISLSGFSHSLMVGMKG